MDVEHDLVEAYFESNGFLVRQAGKLGAISNKKNQHSLRTIAVFNPTVLQNGLSLGFRLYTGDLLKIRFSLVSILSWQNTEFSNGMLSNDRLLLKYFKKEVKENRVEEGFNPSPDLPEYGAESFLRLLVVPSLPKSESKVSEVFTLLKSIRVDGVLTFRSILENLLRKSEPSKIYQAKPIFEILKYLKAYGLAKEPQLEMFQ